MWFYIALGIDIGIILLYMLAAFLDIRSWKDDIPEYFAEKYSKEKIKQAKLYQQQKFSLSLIEQLFLILLLLVALKWNFFSGVDEFVAQLTDNTFWQSYLFLQFLIVALWLIQLPFDYVFIFRIEQTFGFNRSTKSLFFRDKTIELLLESALFFVVGGLVIYLFYSWEKTFGLIAWGIVILYQFLFSLLYQQLIVPLFNKQKPLDDEKLKNEIKAIFYNHGFDVKDVYVIDSSKRTTKANAYFTGWGKTKRIVLYDTLLQQLDRDEIIAVLLHELGHYKHRHTLWLFFYSIIYMGVSIFAFQGSYALICEYLQIRPVFHMALLGFLLFFYPIQFLLHVFMFALSRHFEFQADTFVKRQGLEHALARGLVDLTTHHLGNLHPHPLKIFLTYSHPPVVQRIERLINVQSS